MLHIIIIAHSCAGGSQRHVLLHAHKRPLSLTATGELGGHGQWNSGWLLVRSTQNWAFCSLFTSPLSLLTLLARLSAPGFTVAVTVWHLSAIPACRATAARSILRARSREEDLIVLLAGWSVWLHFNVYATALSVYLHVRTSARCFMKNDQMTRWAVINELSTEHFWPSGKRVPWQSWSASGHRGRGAAAQRALCLCQEPPEDFCTGPAHLHNTRPLTPHHFSCLYFTYRNHDNTIDFPSILNMLIDLINWLNDVQWHQKQCRIRWNLIFSIVKVCQMPI